MGETRFKSEAELCAAFVEWIELHQHGSAVYQEWMDWDLLVVLPSGHQIGVQAKLRLSAEVLLQAIPDEWSSRGAGPDFRAILVPQRTALSRLAEQFGVIVFEPSHVGALGRGKRILTFRPEFTRHAELYGRGGWLDWNPESRLPLPGCATGSVAGSPCPVTLTDWKLRSLKVLAELDGVGTITTKRLKELRVDPRLWIARGWLMPVEKAVWKAGSNRPAIDTEHPEAWESAKSAFAAPPREGDKYVDHS